MEIEVLGSGAGNGVPGWNDGSWEADATRRAIGGAREWRKTAALAVSTTGERFSILEAPLHLPDTVARSAHMAPTIGTRATPIDSILVTSAELEACSGLLGLAASLSIRVFSPNGIRDALIDQNASFRALEPIWSAFAWDRSFSLDREERLDARFFPLPGPTPDYLREEAPRTGRARAGVRITDRETGTRLVWAPRIARFDSACLAELRSADLRFVDGTCYSETESRSVKPGAKSLADLGHTPIDGRDGSLAWLAGMQGQSHYIHIAGTNPASDPGSDAYQRVLDAGIDLCADGRGLTR